MSYTNKILITGGFGFIGQNFVKYFLKNKYKVSLIYKNKKNNSKQIFNFQKITFAPIDISNKKNYLNF